MANDISCDELKIAKEYNPKSTFFCSLVHNVDLAPVDQTIPKSANLPTQEENKQCGNDTVSNKIYSYCGVYLTYSRLHSQIAIHFKDGRFAAILECFNQKYQIFNPGESFHIFENYLYVYNPKETQIYVYGMNTAELRADQDFRGKLIQLEILQTFPIWQPAVNITANKKRIVVLEQDNALRVYSKEGDLLSEDNKSVWLKEYNCVVNSSLAISHLNFIIFQHPSGLVIYHPNGKLFKKKVLQTNAVPQVIITRRDKLCVLSNGKCPRLSFYDVNTLELDHQFDILPGKSTFTPSAICYWDLDDAFALKDKNQIQIYK